MALGKGVARKTGNLVPYLGGQTIRVALFPTIGDKLFLYPYKFFPGSELTAHAPAQYICLSKVQSRKLVGHF